MTILQVWKNARIPFDVNVKDALDFADQVMTEACAEGLLSQAVCFELVDFLLSLKSNDTAAIQKATETLFCLPESDIIGILQIDAANFFRDQRSSKLLWRGATAPPPEILIHNLPSEWSRRTSVGKEFRRHNHNNRYARRMMLLSRAAVE